MRFWLTAIPVAKGAVGPFQSGGKLHHLPPLRFSEFGFLSDFGLRASALELGWHFPQAYSTENVEEPVQVHYTSFSPDRHLSVTLPGHIGLGKNNKDDQADKKRSEDEDDQH